MEVATFLFQEYERNHKLGKLKNCINIKIDSEQRKF